MSYCVNPDCPHPKNPKNVQFCQACGTKLRLHGRYLVLAQLGKGGFGATFAAVDLDQPQKFYCVVKQLRPSAEDPGVFKMAKQLFEREAKTLSLVNHPQIPKLLDYFEEDQRFYLVQEYVKGHNLHQEVKENGPFSEAGVKQFLSEMLPILAHIHSQRLIHRDIKPANLIRRDSDRKLVLIDFGAVKNEVNTVLMEAASGQAALTAFAVGTMGFAPPEQMTMRPVYASDIYALGVTCAYLLTGKVPKDIGSDLRTGELAWQKYVQVSDPFAQVLKKMMDLSVTHRYQSAEEVLEALNLLPYEESLKNSVTAVPPSLGAAPTRTPESRSLRSETPAAPRPPLSQPLTARVTGGKVGGTASQKPPRRPSILAASKRSAKLEAKTILDDYRRGRRDFAQQDLSQSNLIGVHLRGINFYQSNLTRAKCQRADLSEANLGRAILRQATLKNANLSNAYLCYADLEGADLRGANLSGADLKYASLKGTNLCGANLAQAQISETQLAVAKTNWLTALPSGKRGFW